MPQVIAQPLSNHDCGQENAHLAAITKPTHRENPKNDTSCHPQPEHHPVLILQQQSLLCCRSLRLQTKQTVSGITPIIDNLDEASQGLALLMKQQAGMEHVEFTDQQVHAVTVWKVEADYFTAKVREKPQPHMH